ncbi:MAG: hypothetical protein M1829_004615 [Trizodia sp. TS-e1964]|nr:MAG: hypothetical protein M1829_004615 [Trizodia sp. TS-e1964]
MHARFNFTREKRAFYIAGKSISQHAELSSNGAMVKGQIYNLNQHSMEIAFDRLK